MSVNQFATQIENAITAHGTWTAELRTAINVGHSDFIINEVRSNYKCAFGHWLRGFDIDAVKAAGTPYKVINRLHTEFHKCAGDVLEMATSGRAVEATHLLEGEFTRQSEKLVRGLQKWKVEAA